MRPHAKPRASGLQALLIGAAAVCAGAGVGCDVDPGQLLGRRVIAGDYYLAKGEGWFLLEDRSAGESKGCGVIEGDVKELAWSKAWIVARRHSCAQGKQDGWMVIDVQKREISGPLSDDELAQRPELRELQRFSAQAAWKRIPWRFGV
jgi:hypothetical protein